MIHKIILGLFLFMPAAKAEDFSCWEPFQAVNQVESWSFNDLESTQIFLPSYNIDGRYLTQAAAHFDRNASEVQIYFDFKMKGMSLPYNIYRLELWVGAEDNPDSFRYVADFTKGCAEAGIAIFPRGLFSLPAMKIPPHADGRPRSSEPVLIKIWGHL